MIGAKDPGSSVLRMLIESMHLCPAYEPGPIPDQDIVQYQPGQGVKRVTPGWFHGRHAEGETRFTQDPPRVLVSTSTEVQVSAENHGVVLDHGSQISGLELSTGGTEPAVSGGTPRIQMCTQQSNGSTSQRNRRGYGHSALQDERQLDGMGIVQREGGEDGVAPVTLQHAISHGGRVAQVHAQGLSRLDYILLSPELGEQHPAGWPGRASGQGRVDAIRFLDEYDQRDTRVGAQPGVFPIPQARDKLMQLASPDPDIPAQHHKSGVVHSGAGPAEIQSNWRAYVAPPALQPEPLVILVPKESELGWNSQSLPRYPEPVGDLARPDDAGDEVLGQPLGTTAVLDSDQGDLLQF